MSLNLKYKIIQITEVKKARSKTRQMFWPVGRSRRRRRRRGSCRAPSDGSRGPGGRPRAAGGPGGRPALRGHGRGCASRKERPGGGMIADGAKRATKSSSWYNRPGRRPDNFTLPPPSRWPLSGAVAFPPPFQPVCLISDPIGSGPSACLTCRGPSF